MPFFFSKKPSSVAQDLASNANGPSSESTFEIELLGHLDTLYAVSCRMTKSTSEAEDLVQDTVVKAMRAREQFEPGTNLKAWLLRILTNTFINRYRRGGLERDVFEGPDADNLNDGWMGANTMRALRDPETLALTPLVEAEVQRALDDLPPEFRLAVVLSDVEELSYKEISEAMGCPIGTVMSRLHRGRKLLQKTLREHAVALGIVEDVEVTSEAPADLAAYRRKKRGGVMSRSSEARQMIDCALFCKAIDGYVDGELDPAHAIDMEGHVLACTPCADRVSLLRATRHSLRRVAAASAASAALRSRCGDALERERKRAAANREALVDADPKLIRLRYALGLAAAAGVVFAMGMARYRHNRFDAESARARAADGDTAAASVAEGSPAGFDTLLDDLVSLHAHPLPPETTNPDELAHWDPFVGVPVRRPAFQTFGGSFRGARVLANADRRAAMLQYTVLGGHRVTVYVFDPRSVPVQATRLEPRLVRERPVYVGHIRGYSVAAAEERGVGYALASDLDDDKSTDMVLAAMPQ